MTTTEKQWRNDIRKIKTHKNGIFDDFKNVDDPTLPVSFEIILDDNTTAAVASNPNDDLEKRRKRWAKLNYIDKNMESSNHSENVNEGRR